MTTADTLDLTTSTDYIHDIDYGKFTISKVTKSKGVNIVNYYLEDKVDGLHRLSVNKNKNTVKIKFSSKILGLDYHKGIDLNTIENVCNQINKSGIILKTDFINDSVTNFVDVKNDLKLNLEPNKYIDSLNSLISPKFAKTRYPSGITFNENIKSNKLRSTCYTKDVEIQSNRLFYNKFPSLINHFNDILRVESRFRNQKTINKYFNSCDLVGVLSSKNVNLKALIKIIDKQTIIKPVFNTSDMTNTEEQNFAQIYYLNEIFSGDFNSIMNHIKSKLSPNTKATYQRTKVKKYLAMINNAKDLDTIPNLIELQNALKED